MFPCVLGLEGRREELGNNVGVELSPIALDEAPPLHHGVGKSDALRTVLVGTQDVNAVLGGEVV